MIRFSCRKCGKSLRAEEAIVGRSTRCTACQARNRVPTESTRKSGEKQKVLATAEEAVVDDQPGDIVSEEIVTLLADSDSFEQFEDFDFSNLKLDAPPKSSPSSDVSGVPSGAPANPSLGAPRTSTPSSENSASAAARPTILRPASIKKLQSFSLDAWVKPALIAAGILSLLIGGYFLVSFLINRSSLPSQAEFEKSPLGQHYAQVLMDLKKSTRVMEYMENGYRDKSLPESGLDRVNEFKKEYRTLLDDKAAIQEANQLFLSGGEPAARKFVRERIDKMKEMKKEADQLSESLKRQVYGG